MKVVMQRSKKASVSIDEKIHNEIGNGLTVFSCFCAEDTIEDIDYLVKKVLNLRIFDDDDGIMNKSILDINGSILSISQFTLYAITKNGNRPAYINALKGDEAIKLYNIFNDKLSCQIDTKTGVFGADMLINIENDGPVTIIIDSKNK